MEIMPEDIDTQTLDIPTDYVKVLPLDTSNTTFCNKLRLFTEVLMSGVFIKIHIGPMRQAVLGMAEDGTLFIVGKRYESGDLSTPTGCVFSEADWITAKLLFNTVNSITEEGVVIMAGNLGLNSALGRSTGRRKRRKFYEAG